MENLIVIGHKNQDTDATCAAICLAELLNKKKKFKASAKISEKPNNETKYVLNKFKEKIPSKLKKITKEKVFLVDFNENEQSPISFNDIQIEGLIDHHKLNINFKKDYPILFRVEPVGSTCSIIAKMFFEKGVKPTKKIASLLLAGIVSDTLKLTSPTTTDEDKMIVEKLRKISGVKIDVLAKKMFEAKSDLKGIKPQEIITTDYKEFKFGKYKTGIGVFETTVPSSVYNKEREIRRAMSEYKKKNKLDLIFFGIVDILESSTTLFLIGKEEEDALKKAFKDIQVQNGEVFLKNVVSRKKQIVPEFEKNLK